MSPLLFYYFIVLLFYCDVNRICCIIQNAAVHGLHRMLNTFELIVLPACYQVLSLRFLLQTQTVIRNICCYKNIPQIKKDSCISNASQCIIHTLLIDIHESHYLRFARLYGFI